MTQSREEALRELVEKWRKQAENIKKQSLDREPGYFQWLECNREHAGELEAILAQPLAPAQQETLAAAPAEVTARQKAFDEVVFMLEGMQTDPINRVDRGNVIDRVRLLAAAKGGGG